jgi:hypothetical protein
VIDNKSFTTDNTFAVSYPFLWYDITPSASIRVDLKAPDETLIGVYKTVSVAQNAPTKTNSAAQQSDDSYSINGNRSTYWYYEMVNLTNHLSGYGKYIPSFNAVLGNSPYLATGVNVAINNDGDKFSGATSWLAGDHRRVGIANDNIGGPTGASQQQGSFSTLGVSTTGYTFTGDVGGSTYVTLNSSTTVQAHPLWKYIFVNGPCAVTTSGLVLRTGDGIHNSLSSWPATFVPIIMNFAQTRCLFGIDPVTRMVYMGDHEIFGENNSSNWTAGHANWAMLHNIMCWIVNVNRYGDEFNAQFHY